MSDGIVIAPMAAAVVLWVTRGIMQNIIDNKGEFVP